MITERAKSLLDDLQEVCQKHNVHIDTSGPIDEEDDRMIVTFRELGTNNLVLGFANMGPTWNTCTTWGRK